tara:strand:- start:25801 stop:28434 length:2634 start_codon:yes stop_codon:yes gene_type:complete
LLSLPNNNDNNDNDNDNDNDKDGYKNYLEIDEDLNKKIIDEYDKLQKDKELMKKNDKIIPKYLMELHYKGKAEPKELEKHIYKPLKMNIQDTDYPRYETILSKEYQVDQIKYTKELPEIRDPGIEKPIDEKEDRAKLFDPAKSCKGEWSEWNTERCGDPSNHCALKSRKYKIFKAEKPGGDSCKFKDGEEQFDYCYGKNHKERCGHSRNLCQCDLNKFDGDPSNCNMETDVNCRCPPGFSFNDVDVTNFVKNAGLLGKDGEDSTERDRIGYDPTFSLKKGSCRKNNCFCDNGTAAEGTSCKNDGDHICELTPCNTGSILKGNPPRCYEAKKGSLGKIIEPNCPYSNGERVIMATDPEWQPDVGGSCSDSSYTDEASCLANSTLSSTDEASLALSNKENKFLYCGTEETICSEGYELRGGVDDSDGSDKCKSFYSEFDFDLFTENGTEQTPPVSCCLPKPGECKFSEIAGEGKPYRNIFDGDNDLKRLRTMNINQLRRINYNGTDADLSAQPEDPLGTNGEKGKCLDFTNSDNNDELNSILINSGDSKASMVQYIYNNACDKPIDNCVNDSILEDDNNELCRSEAIKARKGNCFIQGSIDNCKNVFTCNNGYQFVPDNQGDNDLLVTECKEGEIPKFNGKCVPQKCGIDPSTRERYKISRSIDECDNTLGINCGIINLSCRKDEYKEVIDGETVNPKLECDGNILKGTGCNNGQIPFAEEANNERYQLLTAEKDLIVGENQRLTVLRDESLAKKLRYQNIDLLIKTRENPVADLSEAISSDTTSCSPGAGAAVCLSQDQITDIEDNFVDSEDYYNNAYTEYTSLANDDPRRNESFQSQRLQMEALNQIRLAVRISRNDTTIAEIQKEIDDLDSIRSGN